MSSPSPGKRRMDTDVIKLIETNHEVTILGGLNEFLVKFQGPKGTAYDGGVWRVRVDLPEKYPFKSPSIGFVNRIYHPNIDEASGTVCLDVINQSWTALYDLVNVFESFLPQLLTYPNPADPLNGDAAALYLHKPEEFAKKVKDYVQRYATEDALRDMEKREQAHMGACGGGHQNGSQRNGSSSQLQQQQPQFSSPGLPPPLTPSLYNGGGAAGAGGPSSTAMMTTATNNTATTTTNYSSSSSSTNFHNNNNNNNNNGFNGNMMMTSYNNTNNININNNGNINTNNNITSSSTSNSNHNGGHHHHHHHQTGCNGNSNGATFSSNNNNDDEESSLSEASDDETRDMEL